MVQATVTDFRLPNGAWSPRHQRMIGVVEVDQVVRGIGEEGQPLVGAGPPRRRVCRRDKLGRDLRCCAEGGVVQHRKILIDGPAHRLGRQALVARHAALTVGVSPDQTGIHGKAFAADQAFGDAAADHRLEQLAQQIAVAEAAMPVLREGRVVRHVTVEAETAEPPIRQIEVHLLAEPPLRANAAAIADEQHAYQQFRVDRGSPDRAVERRHMSPHALQVHESINRPQQMVGGNMPLQRELVEQRRLIDLPLAHHRRFSRRRGGVNQDRVTASTSLFQQNRWEADLRRRSGRSSRQSPISDTFEFDAPT